MPGDVTAPSTLQGHAKEIWKSAFLSAYNETCEGDDAAKDECAAKIAWSAVKNVYSKNEKTGEWVEKASDPASAPVSDGMDQYPAPTSGSDGLTPTPAGLPLDLRDLWESAFNDALRMECSNAIDPRKCATQVAWAKVKEKHGQDSSGQWVKRNMLNHLIEKHYGPGPHKGTGTPQEVHGGGGGKVSAGTGGFSSPRHTYQGDKGEKPPWSDENAGKVSTAKLAKTAVATIFERFGVPHGSMSARQVSFSDLARGSAFDVTVNDIDWQKWIDAGPSEIKSSLPKEVILSPKFINLPEGITIASSMTPEAFQARRVFDRKKREKLAGEGKALPWGGFPIENCGDVKNAVQAIGRAKDRSRTIAHIKKHASSLGCTHLIPKKWREGAKAEEKSAVAMNEDSKFYDSEEQLVHRARVAGLDPKVLLKRRSLRASAHAEDIALLEAGYADNPARRPDEIPSEVWRSMEPHERTVGAVVWRRHVERKYEEAVEDALLKGWKGQKNPSRPEEWIFKSWVDTPDGWQLVRTILVRKSDSDEWYMKEVSRGASLSLSIRVAPGEVRR